MRRVKKKRGECLKKDAKKMRAPLNDKADGYKEIGESHQKEVEGVFKMRVITYQSRRGRGEDLPSMLSAARNPLCLLSRCSPAHDGIFRKMDLQFAPRITIVVNLGCERLQWHLHTKSFTPELTLQTLAGSTARH